MSARIAVLALVLGGWMAPSPAAGGAATARFARELAQAGRAEATVRITLPGASAGARPVHATLTLEPPGFARLDVPATGERIVLRPEGGDWLQPTLRQVLRLRAEHNALAMRWWQVLLEPEAIGERRLPDGHWRVWHPASGDSAELWLDARGRPSRLSVPEEAGGGTFHLAAWRFGRPRGAAAYRVRVPAGWEAVELP